MEKTYIFEVNGFVRVTVEGDNEIELEEKAEQFMVDADFGPLEDIEWTEPKEY